ncbi:hypothetical protein PUW25_25990 (plasmid) [Paenibacillus urinalis]|uniref:Uncharacterized protein n=1 Tax=Paenibacillus urinalis TaxID=521520 RepID=A0ABY7XKE7_9BACL|nr:hypothetical protein [Paenibacillus urinalis]WDI05022.1 hypothetical protein PUW25_25990 [Paenibacillus urinalis]
MSDKRYILFTREGSSEVRADDTQKRYFDPPGRDHIIFGFDNQKAMARKANELLRDGCTLLTRGGREQLRIFKSYI